MTARNLAYNGKIPPGGSVTFGLLGKAGTLANPTPNLITLNGTACTLP